LILLAFRRILPKQTEVSVAYRGVENVPFCGSQLYQFDSEAPLLAREGMSFP
jgi:hypothetical protein